MLFVDFLPRLYYQCFLDQLLSQKLTLLTRSRQATSGSRVVASEYIPEDTEIVSCPFDLAITRQHAQLALGIFLDTSEIICNTHWSERQWISTYIIFHWIICDERYISISDQQSLING